MTLNASTRIPVSEVYNLEERARHLRKAMREQRTQAATGDIIEGEAVVVENDRVRARTFLPDEPSDRDRP